MKRISAGILALALAGCARGGTFIELSSPVKAGQTVAVVEMETSPPRDLSIHIVNVGPESGSDADCGLEIHNGDRRLGRIGKGDSLTFTASGETLKLWVRAEGGDTRFNASIAGSRGAGTMRIGPE